VRESVKHRLIGAAVLAAVAVLFLPGFFKDRQQYQVDTSSHIPGRPSITAVDFNEPDQPDDIEPAPSPETMFVPADPETLPVIKDEDAKEVLITNSASSSPAYVSSVAQSSVATSIMSLSDKGLPEGWIIQVVSLRAQDSANKLRDQLQAEGHRAYVRAVPLDSSTVYRVFIGPKQSEAEANTLKFQLDKRLKVNSLVLPFKP
jgi:DedD protein